jgi:hypothetical protein
MTDPPFDPRQLSNRQVPLAELRKQLGPLIDRLLEHVPENNRAEVAAEVARYLDTVEAQARDTIEPGSTVLAPDAVTDLLRAAIDEALGEP